MIIDIKHINEFHSLYGGIKKKKEIGNAFQALVSDRFDDSLLFAIVETVNLTNPSLFGLGDTLFFTHTSDEYQNIHIKEEYKRIISAVEDRFNHALAEYVDWYEMDSVFVTVNNESNTTFNSDNCGWRTRIFANREEKGDKNKYGFQKFLDQGNGISFKQHVEEYLRFYVDLLQTNLSFAQFPHFVIIAKPISTKDKDGIIKLGNLYLHFATTVAYPSDFYERLLNDFLLIWLREEGSVLIKQITSEAAEKITSEITQEYRAHLPNIWTNKDSRLFRKEEIEKLGREFSKSSRTLNDFYDEIFIHNTLNCRRYLENNERVIREELVPILLKHKGWLKDGITTQKASNIITSIRQNVEHKKFDGFDEDNLKRFASLLSLRHLVNLCLCCFQFDIDVIHSLLTTGEIQREDRNARQYLNKITPYFTKLFFFSPKGKNILNFQQQDAYNSSSLKEKDFIKSCVIKISQQLKQDKKREYNKIVVENFRLDSADINSFRSDNVSRLAVFDFKKNWCDENEIIIKLLKENADKYLVPPILDCGAGLGDIAFGAFREKESILIDVNPIEDKETPISPYHKNVTKNFFEFYPDKRIETLLISHTLQFIDSDIDALNHHIHFLDPSFIVLITNQNDDIMGDILNWTKDNYAVSNPEERIANFPLNYKLIDTISFKASVKCTTFSQLARQIGYLMMIDLAETGNALEKYLRTKLAKPEFVFNQVIEIFEKSPKLPIG